MYYVFIKNVFHITNDKKNINKCKVIYRENVGCDKKKIVNEMKW